MSKKGLISLIFIVAIVVGIISYNGINNSITGQVIAGADLEYAIGDIVSEAIQTADYDGDGKADIAVYETEERKWIIKKSSTNYLVPSSRKTGTAELNRVPADYDGDGRADYATYYQGTWTLTKSSDGSYETRDFGWAAADPVPADYDGDGKTDIAVYHQAEGMWYLMKSTDGFKTEHFGFAEAIPVQADYDGDGKVDLAVYCPTNCGVNNPGEGWWFIMQSKNGFKTEQFGWAEAGPVPADYDGDGKADIAVYGRGGGEDYANCYGGEYAFYVMGTEKGFKTHCLGDSYSTPVPADYDGDGKADFAIYEGALGKWGIKLSTLEPVTLQPISCADTDPDNNIYVKGIVTDTEGITHQDICYIGGVIGITDSCSADDTTCKVYEKGCNGAPNNDYLESSHDCEFGCSYGACLPNPEPAICTDTDPDNNIYVKGIVTDTEEGIPYPDTCRSGLEEASTYSCSAGDTTCKVFENGCEGNPSQYYFEIVHVCEFGCEDGACMCASGYSWNGSACAVTTCEEIEGICSLYEILNSEEDNSGSCSAGTCYVCNDNSTWNGYMCFETVTETCEGCEDSRVYGGACLKTGFRLEAEIEVTGNFYCGYDGEFTIQTAQNASCQNSYECESNSCSNGVCVDIIEKLDMQIGLLKQIWCWLTNIGDTTGYDTCIAS